MHLLRLGLRSWKTQPLTQALTTLSLALLVWVWLGLFWMYRNMQPLLSRVQSDRQMVVFFAPTSNIQDDSKRVDAIRLHMGSHAVRADSFQYRGVTDFLQAIEKRDGELLRELKALGPDMHQVVPRTVAIRGGSIDRKAAFVQSVQSVDGVEKVETSDADSASWTSLLRQSRRITQFFLLALVAIAGVMLWYHGKFQAQMDRKSLDVLHMLGAPAWARAIPRWIQGASLGAVASVLGVIAWLVSEPVALELLRNVDAWRLWNSLFQPLRMGWILIVPLAMSMFGGLVWSVRRS